MPAFLGSQSLEPVEVELQLNKMRIRAGRKARRKRRMKLRKKNGWH